MGYQIAYDSRWRRDVGYGVPAFCDHPGCDKAIDRGFDYVCGGDAYGGDHGCGLFFCGEHLGFACSDDERKSCGYTPMLCQRCTDYEQPFEPSREHPTWLEFKLVDESWAHWRSEHPAAVAAMRAELAKYPQPVGSTTGD
ncbi:Uncharacterised protein [Mycobacteroides abscessus subsp. abscessus]|uniref:hypothetical protein n=1 Tax=Mycobacteroides abscessus TaxID=36809 RepID=UPI00092674D9|nr:hypothetical protein [Mycobacteroides abscessus]SHU64691.1 Uncharacterised protein [Mycobacteroides abscessus subsp. abscessus]